MMHERFQMSYIGELTFFLVLQVKQKDDGIFISQDKYVADILKKFDFTTVKTASTLMEPNKALIKDAKAEDFWTSAKVKTVNEDARLQALVDGKKVIVNEASIRRNLRLDDSEGTTYLPNAAIFEELARISTMASAIICLANNQKFNFSKYILDNMVKNLEDGVKFYMFLRFVQVFVNHQLDDMSQHKGIFVNSSLTKKVFANMKRVGTDTPILTQPSSSQPQRKHKSKRKQRKETEVPHTEPQTEEHIPTPSKDLLPSGEDRLQLNELMEICKKLFDSVLSLEQTKTNQVAEIEKLKKKVKKLEGKKKKRTHGLKRLYKVSLSARIVSSDEEGLGDQEDASKQGRIAEIDVDEDLSLINKTAQHQGRMNEEDLFRVNDLDGDEVIMDVTAGKNVEQDATVAEKEVSIAADEVITTAATTLQISKDDVTLAQALIEIKTKDKGKGIMVEPEKPLKKKDQIALDEKVARKLEAQMKAKIRQINEGYILHEVFGYIPLMKTKILIKKLEDSKGEHQVYERIVRIKGLYGVTTVQKLRLLSDEGSKYAK
nr:ribonuclease H-like domain, reverse transcriptase, RNA-dependent DNA polymerase [Tanacetum cinerariifolium]